MAGKKREVRKLTEWLPTFNASMFKNNVDSTNAQLREEGWNYLKMHVNHVPTPDVINYVIFKFMMQTSDPLVISEAGVYLSTFLETLSPELYAMYNFQVALMDTSGSFPDLWSFYSHLVLSALHHLEIPVKEPRKPFIEDMLCGYLLDFYTRVLSVNINMLFEDEFDERFVEILVWLNLLYKHDGEISSFEVFHNLLDHVIRKRVHSSDVSSINEILNGTLLSETVDLFLCHCKDIFSNIQNLRLFFKYSNVPVLQLKLCQHKLHQIIYKRKLPKDKKLSLETIAEDYLFSTKKENNTHVKVKFRPQKEQKSNKHRAGRGNFIQGGSKLHIFANDGKFADFFEALTSGENLDINSKNRTGNTPLHEACLSNSYHCARMLTDDAGSRQVDYRATNLQGRTPMHLAAQNNAVAIVQHLLKHGGDDLKNIRDKSNLRPIDYAKTEELFNLLKIDDVEKELQFNEKEFTSHIHTIKTRAEYCQMLGFLHFLLELYLNIYGLAKSSTTLANTKNRVNQECRSNNSVTLYEEDLRVYQELPGIILRYIDNVKEHSEKINVNVSNMCKLFDSLLKLLK